MICLILVLLSVSLASVVPEETIINNYKVDTSMADLIKSQTHSPLPSLELPPYPTSDNTKQSKIIEEMVKGNSELMKMRGDGSNVDNGRNNSIEGIRNFIKEGDLNKINGKQNIINGSKNDINGNSNNVYGHSNKIIDSSNNVVYGSDNTIQTLPMPNSKSTAYLKPNPNTPNSSSDKGK